MSAALDRCRSYRGESGPACVLLAVGNELADRDAGPDAGDYRISRMTFSGNGLGGSRTAALNHSRDMDMGHIWLVDAASGRDCKGEWRLAGTGASWRMLCLDGLTAEGEMTSPREGAGRGSGRTSGGDPVAFTFAPDPVP